VRTCRMIPTLMCVCACVAVLVGAAQSWLPELVERASKLNVNGGFEKGADL
jgi:malonate-semialdehyde dehydrogenase (acetylating)/methylmalonate-semialdehyde dehydrogenase